MKSLTEEQKKLVTDTLPLVHYYVTYKIFGYNNSYEDLYQTGCLALCQAAVHYNPLKGANFRTYASKVILNHLYDYCRKHENPLLLNEPYALEALPDPTSMQGMERIEDETLKVLSTIKEEYSGIAKKGMEALYLKCKGYSGVEIARIYQVKSNEVGAWISRACKKLRKDKQMLQAFGREQMEGVCA